jgi:hypothetical protein
MERLFVWGWKQEVVLAAGVNASGLLRAPAGSCQARQGEEFEVVGSLHCKKASGGIM